MEAAAPFAKGCACRRARIAVEQALLFRGRNECVAAALTVINQHQETFTVLGFPAFTGHGEPGRQGHSDAATRASVESALHAAPDIEAGEITVSISGSYVILEGFVRRRGDVERAIEIAEGVVGRGYVRARLLRS